ncbi:hypothetical protein BDW42DRAFT_190474 [Aspergillus taichungensis]|uniref:Uncharacterized protein n=1 Tax=Aspergillus taichungensis TaxID=482145 RepID=A0A2J5I7I4_9EURO|nr:hypothetical protein BDW42DRAFT_190474 [Aspergillus taichungensis]
MMDVVDFELCLNVDKYRKNPQPKPQFQNPPEADAKAGAEPIPLLKNAPPKSPLVRKYAEFVEEEYHSLSRKEENEKGNNDIGFWLSLPPKRPRLLPSDVGVGLEDSASGITAKHGTVERMGSTGDQGRGLGACVDGDGDTMMDVDTGVLLNSPVTTTTSTTATITPPPPPPTPGRMPARPFRLPPSASTQFAIYEDPDTMDVDEANATSTPLRSPMYNTAPTGSATTSNNNSHYLHPYVSSQTDEDKENTENEDDGEEDSNTASPMETNKAFTTEKTIINTTTNIIEEDDGPKTKKAKPTMKPTMAKKKTATPETQQPPHSQVRQAEE